MGKKFISIIVCLSMILSLLVLPASAANGSLTNFKKYQTYTVGQYADVPATNTFSENVKAGYEYGIMQGYGTTFGVSNSITRLASIIIACRLNAIYYTGANNIAETYTGTTQEIHLQYANDHDILCNFGDVSKSATRAEFAAILSSALPDEALSEINTVEDNAIPDVSMNIEYSADIYRLYRAGILNGSDKKGTFYPNSNITRGAACAIATRMCDISLRKSVNLSASTDADGMTAEEVYKSCSPAVFYIEVYDSTGSAFASGSGFFIDSYGTAVTNFHVIDGCQSAKITTTNGKTYDVAGVYDYSEDHDWAVLKVSGSGFTYLTIGDSSENVAGAPVYALGSPLGFSDSISEGIISSTSRTYDGTNYIQTTAPISSGSSGGALITKKGHVIGITTGSFEDGQNLNVAVPLTYINGYSSSSVTPFTSLFKTDSGSQSGSSVDLPAIYNYLCYIVYAYANTEVNGNPAYEFQRGNDIIQIIYNLDEQEIQIGDTFYSDSGLVIYTLLAITEDLAPYQAVYLKYPSIYSSTASSTGIFTVNPYYFTPDTVLAFDVYNGYSQWDDMELGSVSVVLLVMYLEPLFNELGDGFSIWDLGFYSIYNEMYS